MIDGLALRSDAATANAIAAFAKCISDPAALAKLNTAFGEDRFGDWLLGEATKRSLRWEDVRKRGLPYDLVINGHRVQAKCGAGKTGRLDCSPVRAYAANRNVRRYPLSAIDVMAVCLLSSFEVFLIPTDRFRCPKHAGMVRGSFCRKRFGEWKDAWHVLDGAPGPEPVQLMLF